ncbi:MAG: type IV pilin protein [Pseudomonadota bacterium]
MIGRTPIDADGARRKRHGFTLVELLVALAILAIVSAIAIPAYNSYSIETYRGEAKSDLLLCAQGLERFASENFTYVGGADGSGVLAAPVCQPLSGTRYDITATVAADTFTLTATPRTGIMSGDGALEYGSNGVRRWNKFDGGWQTGWEE